MSREPATPPDLPAELRRLAGGNVGPLAGAAMEKAADEIDDLRTSVIAFGGPWAVEHAERSGLPRGHLHPVHYDCLARAGARMDDFTRAEIANAD